MFKRLLWIGIGIALGVIVSRRIGRARRNLGPEGVNRAVGQLSDRVHHTVDIFTESKQQREGELRRALGLD